MHVLITCKFEKDRINSNGEQVAQRATIAHLSPMCQGKILFKKNNREKVETPFSPL